MTEGEIKAEKAAPTGPLTGPPVETAPSRAHCEALAAQLIVLLAALLGAIALGLGISDYFLDHPYVLAYLVAFAAFLFSDLIVRNGYTVVDEGATRLLSGLPVLLLFAAAPFERTYIYGGEASGWSMALGVLVELFGLWLALGARVQFSYFAPSDGGAPKAVIRHGFYRYVRHPVYGGTFLVMLGWPLEYEAPLVFVVAAIVGFIAMGRWIMAEEAELLRRFGDEYLAYQRETDRLIPSVW